MNNSKALKYAGISSITLALLSPSLSLADASQSNGAIGHSFVHRVSHSLADANAYTGGSNSGYKWGKKAGQTDTNARGANGASDRGSYRWGNSTPVENSDARNYAGATSYQWGTMSFPEQSGYKWGIRSYADQSGYKWGIRSYAEQSAYKSGTR
jgi:hypothetical protein